MSYINSQKIYDLISLGKIEPLSSEYEIEDLLSVINSFNDKIEFLEGLKKNRVASIEDEINKYEDKRQFLKDIILATLEKFNKKSLAFPDVGKVHIKTTSGKWIIDDETSLIDIIKKELPSSEVNKIISNKEVISKSDINNVLDEWEKINKIPSCVRKDEEKKSVTVKIDKDFQPEDIDILDSEPVDLKLIPEEKIELQQNLEEYDDLGDF